MKRPIVLLVAVAVLAGSCSRGGVSQAEYDQTVAELALAQQELLAARDDVSSLQSTLGELDPEGLFNQIAVLEAEVAQRDDLARSVIEEQGGVVDAARSPLEQLAEMTQEAATGPGNDGERLDAYLALISLVTGLGLEAAPEAALLEDLRPTVDATLDMELTGRYDELRDAAAERPETYRAEALRFIQDATGFAMQVNAGSRPPG
jgi:hypothetical protein